MKHAGFEGRVQLESAISFRGGQFIAWEADGAMVGMKRMISRIEGDRKWRTRETHVRGFWSNRDVSRWG